jgi:very-short-patch-repair endonuclease
MLHSADQLEEAAQKNKSNAAELKLILSELAHRRTKKTRQLEKLVQTYLLDCNRQDIKEKVPRNRGKRTVATPKESDTMTEKSSEIDDTMRRFTEGGVAELRAKLIDLSRRNPLISFKHGSRSASMVRIVDERPDLLFETISKKGMRFEALPDEETIPPDEDTAEFKVAYERAQLTNEAFLAETETLGDDEADAQRWDSAERTLRAVVREELGLPRLDYGKAIDVAAIARAHGFDPSYDLKSSDDPISDHHKDDRIRVLLTPKECDKRLKTIWERYRSHQRETGLHTLFLAMGFVQWFDDNTGDTPNYAPALLLAVEIERKVVRGRYEYTLSTHDEGLQINVALAEKMRQHWQLAMPELRTEETPESYFIRLESVLEKGHRLKLRHFATLCVLPFPRMVLWKDLDPDAWPENAFAGHCLLPALLGAAPMGGDPSPSEPYDIDSPEWSDRAPTLIRPADASQHSALIETADGANLAIEGPPGTGKSETITNIIATAISQNKKVLFVAEKQAALRVVADRLKASGLGELVLELHGENAKRDEFYRSLRVRLDARAEQQSDKLELRRRELTSQRDLLRNYLALLDTSLGALGRKTYDLVWRELILRANVSEYAETNFRQLVTINDVALIDQTGLIETRSQLTTYAKAIAALDNGRNARPLWLKAQTLPVFDQSSQINAASRAAESAAAFGVRLDELSAVAAVDLPGPWQDIQPLLDQLSMIEPFDDLPEDMVKAALREPETVRSLLQKQSRWRQLYSRASEEMNNVNTANPQTVNALANALAAVTPTPETARNAVERAVQSKLACESWNRVGVHVTSVITRLCLPSDLTGNALLVATEAVKRLSEVDEKIRAFYSQRLLDPVAGLVLGEESDRAESICSERDAVKSDLRDPTNVEPSQELLRIADILEETGFFARIFSREFRAARRRAASILRDSADREVAVDALRRTARYQRQADSFHADSASKTYFPDVLWKGAGSDFSNLREARTALDAARQSFATIGASFAIGEYLALSVDDQAMIGRAASELAPALEHALQYVPVETCVSDISVELATARDNLHQLDDSIQALTIRSECQLVRDGESLDERISALLSSVDEFDVIRQHAEFGWVGTIDEPLEALSRALQSADKLRASQDTMGLVQVLSRSERPVSVMTEILGLRETLVESAGKWQEAEKLLFEIAGLEAKGLCENSDRPTSESWHKLAEDLTEMAADKAGVKLAADLFKYRADLSAAGLTLLAESALSGAVEPNHLADIYELAFVNGLLRQYLTGDGADLQRAGGLSLAAARNRFVEIDLELHALEAKAILADRLNDDTPWGIDYGLVGEYTEKALLNHELGLRRPRTPLRDVVHRAGNALQTLKPVWMMSPASAAQYIRPGSLQFDLIVMDEASQMRPEYAISSVLRGKQFVVVGDANQLPPSDHFQSRDDGEQDDDSTGIAVDTESILDLASSRFRRKRRLKWAYRFQHESLIQFSNREFYDGDLVVFPSPIGADDDLLGVRCFYVPNIHPDTYYESSINQREAQAVIEEAFRLMIAYPERSIGIAAMNAKQTELIQNDFDRLQLEQPEVRKYLDRYADSVDEFFIKNLENVQGDERDIILVSTVYGQDRDGIVKQNFGLMNREVGWRRLNVLVTRAKLAIRIFTSLRPNDVKVTANSSRGIRAFHAYLTYIHGGGAADDPVGGDAESPFEDFVAEKLRANGYDVVPQVGVNGFRIDLGVRHRDFPLGFLAGVECDGAPYHTGHTVRDRDRIRQTQLENLGWRIYRIWSVDWYADPDRETQRLLRWLNGVRERRMATLAEKPQNPPKTKQSAERAADIRIEKPDYHDEPERSDIEVAERKFDEESSDDQEARKPVGRRMRDVDGIVWYEDQKDRLYSVWDGETLIGEVMVLSRANAAPKLYGDQIVVARSEYEGKVSSSGELFKSDDIYAAIRKIARLSMHQAHAVA